MTIHALLILQVCHRAELHRCMVEAVEATGITLNLGAEITEIDFKRTALKYHKRNTNEPESKSIEYDLIIAADGVKSNIRRQMLALHGEIDKAQDTVRSSACQVSVQELNLDSYRVKPPIGYSFLDP